MGVCQFSPALEAGVVSALTRHGCIAEFPPIIIGEVVGVCQFRGGQLLPAAAHPRHQIHKIVKKIVGAAGFEPAAPCSQSRCANRTAPRPDVWCANPALGAGRHAPMCGALIPRSGTPRPDVWCANPALGAGRHAPMCGALIPLLERDATPRNKSNRPMYGAYAFSKRELVLLLAARTPFCFERLQR